MLHCRQIPSKVTGAWAKGSQMLEPKKHHWKLWGWIQKKAQGRIYLAGQKDFSFKIIIRKNGLYNTCSCAYVGGVDTQVTWCLHLFPLSQCILFLYCKGTAHYPSAALLLVQGNFTQWWSVRTCPMLKGMWQIIGWCLKNAFCQIWAVSEISRKRFLDWFYLWSTAKSTLLCFLVRTLDRNFDKSLQSLQTNMKQAN